MISNVVVPTPKKQKKNEENTLVDLFSHVPVDQVSTLNTIKTKCQFQAAFLLEELQKAFVALLSDGHVDWHLRV